MSTSPLPINIAKNTSARLHAVQAIYQIHQTGHKAEDVIPEFIEHRFGALIDGEQYIYPDKDLFTQIVLGVEGRKDDLLSLLKDTLKKEGKARNVEDLIKSILLCGALEILDHTDIPAPIIVNDYVEVTKAYYGGSEKSIVNAVLDTFQKTVR